MKITANFKGFRYEMKGSINFEMGGNKSEINTNEKIFVSPYFKEEENNKRHDIDVRKHDVDFNGINAAGELEVSGMYHGELDIELDVNDEIKIFTEMINARVKEREFVKEMYKNEGNNSKKDNDTANETTEDTSK